MCLDLGLGIGLGLDNKNHRSGYARSEWRVFSITYLFTAMQIQMATALFTFILKFNVAAAPEKGQWKTTD